MNQNKNYKFIDLFAGAGGLSEGFIRAGFEPIAHIEMDHYACDTLKTRAAYHYLKANNKLSIYEQYLRTKKEKTDGAWLWNQVPKEVIDTVIQEAIGKETIDGIFKKVDRLCKGQKVDIIIGGPPCQAYSIAGRARLGKKIEDDPRNDLYKFWKSKITNQIIKELKSHENKVLINLASSEYLKCIDLKLIKKDFNFLDIVFKDYDLKTNTYKVKGLYAKKARGYMCRFIIKNKIDCIDDLLKFNIEGYTYNNELSHGDVITFTRKNI